MKDMANTIDGFKLSPNLRGFLQDWLDWTNGKETTIGYREDAGLCISVLRYNMGAGPVSEELEMLLVATCGDSELPFGRLSYAFDRRDFTMHNNPVRLSWVRAALDGTLANWRVPVEVLNDR